VEHLEAHFHAFISIFFHKICRRIFECNAFMMQSDIYIVLAVKVFTNENQFGLWVKGFLYGI
jgi:hypothetical protein